MELFQILTLLSIILSFILPPCANSQQILVKYSPQEQADHELQVTLLPRKFTRKVMKDTNVKSVETRSNTHVLQNNQKETLVPGKFQQKREDLLHAKKGTWQEWKERTDSSQFFSMDYSHVRRRRPIHNKFTPVVAP